MPTFPLKKRGFEARLRQTQAALLGLFPSGTPLVLHGRRLTSDVLSKRWAKTLALFDQVREAKLAWQSALAALHGDLAESTELWSALRPFAHSRLGTASPKLAALGFAPKARRKLAKTLAAAKKEATRSARGVVGRRKRLSIQAAPGPTLLVLGPDGQPLGARKR